MKNQAIATGKVLSLCRDGNPIPNLTFALSGPVGDSHSGSERKLNGHDVAYINTSDRKKGDVVFNWRTWTALSQEELAEIEGRLELKVPQGCLLENFVVSGIPNFSKLKPTTRLVFQSAEPEENGLPRPILTVWGENSPCNTVGLRLEEHHEKPRLKTDFVAAAQHRRGVMGFVLASGFVKVGDKVLVYPPVE